MKLISFKVFICKLFHKGKHVDKHIGYHEKGEGDFNLLKVQFWKSTKCKCGVYRNEIVKFYIGGKCHTKEIEYSTDDTFFKDVQKKGMIKEMLK